MNGAPTPGPGDHPFAGNVLQVCVRWDTGMRPRWVTHVVTLRSLQDVEEEEMPCEDRSRGWGDAVTSPGPWESTGARRVLPRSLQREHSPAATLFGVRPQNCDNKLLFFPAATAWPFGTAATGE